MKPQMWDDITDDVLNQRKRALYNKTIRIVRELQYLSQDEGAIEYLVIAQDKIKKAKKCELKRR